MSNVLRLFETLELEVFIVLLEIKIQCERDKQTEILTDTEISGPPCAFLISVDLQQFSKRALYL